jgi:uncharacterized protein (UPF0147 family)
MKESDEVKVIIEGLKEILGDASVPKNIKENIEKVISTLNNGDDLPVKISKVLSELDEVSNDTNIQPYTRTQIWNIVSMLEKIIS